MKIVILNVKYSPNLGDGVIAECLESQLKQLDQSIEVTSLDIGGMSTYQVGGSILGPKLSIMKLVKKLPKSLKHFVFKWIIPIVVKLKYKREWSKIMSDADAVIIGGGHLFMDVDHYFPMRLKIASSFAKPKTPLFIHSVGVSSKMSLTGNKMFNDIFDHCQLITASVRDENALQNWRLNFPRFEPKVCRDPGLLAFSTYSELMGDKKHTKRKVIGFGVSDPLSMTPHGDSAEGVACGNIDFYTQAISTLAEDYEIKLFTNGEDFEFLNVVANAVRALPKSVVDRVTVQPRPVIPSQLVNIITSCDVIIAHRLHANIIAYSYGIPHIGLGWDDKLKAFFKYIDRDEFLIVKTVQSYDELLQKVHKALTLGINNQQHKTITVEALDGIATLFNDIRSSIKS